MTKDSLLNQDELDFIHTLMQRSGDSQPATASSFRVDGGSAGNALLQTLGQQTQLHMSATLDDLHLSFPLHLVKDEFSSLHLELGAPRIYQRGPGERDWRQPLHPALRLQHADGTPSHLLIHELSVSGALLSSATDEPLPTDFQLWLPLPTQEPVQLNGQLVRQVSHQRSAFRLVGLPASHHSRLCHFIFNQFRHSHPLLKTL